MTSTTIPAIPARLTTDDLLSKHPKWDIRFNEAEKTWNVFPEDAPVYCAAQSKHLSHALRLALARVEAHLRGDTESSIRTLTIPDTDAT
jgi:hypothetical protein